MDANKLKNNVLEGLKYYAVDTTALLTTSTPIYAAMETFGSGMSSDVSLEARMKIVGLSYMGLALLFTKTRDLSKYLFKVTDESSKKMQIIHDALYATAFNIAASIPVYVSSGTDLEQTVKGTAGAVILSLTTGWINCFGVDMYRDFTGLKPSLRLSKGVRDLNTKVKLGIAAGLIGASIGLTSLVYDVKDAFDNKQNKEKTMGAVLSLKNENKVNAYSAFAQ